MSFKIDELINKFDITKEQIDSTNRAFIKDGYIEKLPAREKKKVILLFEIASHFEAGKEYTESDVNEIIAKITPDYATVRRYLIDYKLLNRTKDCKKYWKNN